MIIKNIEIIWNGDIQIDFYNERDEQGFRTFISRGDFYSMMGKAEKEHDKFFQLKEQIKDCKKVISGEIEGGYIKELDKEIVFTPKLAQEMLDKICKDNDIDLIFWEDYYL